MVDRVVKETARHVEAFEQYIALKATKVETKDAVQVVSIKQGVSTTSVYRWKKSFNWDEREDERLKQIYKELRKATNKTIAEYKKEYLDDIERILQNWREEGGKIDIKNTNDLNNLVRLGLILQGEDDGNGVKININKTLLDDIHKEK